MSNPKPKSAKSETRFTETETRDNILEEMPIGFCQYIQIKTRFLFYNIYDAENHQKGGELI